MNEYQEAVWNHLTSGGPERLVALHDLVERGVFLVDSDKDGKPRVKGLIEAYLSENPRGFCQAGIERFRQAIDPGPKERRVLVTLDLTVINDHRVFGQTDTSDCTLMKHLHETLTGSRGRNADGGEIVVKSAHYRNYRVGTDEQPNPSF